MIGRDRNTKFADIDLPGVATNRVDRCGHLKGQGFSVGGHYGGGHGVVRKIAELHCRRSLIEQMEAAAVNREGCAGERRIGIDLRDNHRRFELQGLEHLSYLPEHERKFRRALLWESIYIVRVVGERDGVIRLAPLPAEVGAKPNGAAAGRESTAIARF